MKTALKLTTLPLDVTRCTSRMHLGFEGEPCTKRGTCARYMSLTQWDAGNVPIYQNVPVMMALPICDMYIHAEERP